MGGSLKEALMTEIIPFTAMVAVEGCIIGLTIMASTAMAKGVSPFVFVVYTNALGTIILLPYSFFYHRNDHRWDDGVLFTFPFLLRVFLLGLIGVTIAQNLAFVGLSYSSPIVACGMANQIPAFSYIAGFFFRTTKMDWDSSASRARVVGTLISFIGAISLTLYKGPTIKNPSSPSFALQNAAKRLLVFTSPHENWVLGCFLYAASSVILTFWNYFQVGTVKMCSQVMKIASFYSLFGTIQSTFLAFYLERDPSAWRLELNFDLVVIVLTAIFSSLIKTNIQMWCTRLKGPNFVPIFKPFGIPYASTFGSLLFADTFHYGSMMGAFICGVGYYTALWGQFKDEETHKFIDESSKSTSFDERIPLLQEHDSQV